MAKIKMAWIEQVIGDNYPYGFDKHDLRYELKRQMDKKYTLTTVAKSLAGHCAADYDGYSIMQMQKKPNGTILFCLGDSARDKMIEHKEAYDALAPLIALIVKHYKSIAHGVFREYTIPPEDYRNSFSRAVRYIVDRVEERRSK